MNHRTRSLTVTASIALTALGLATASAQAQHVGGHHAQAHLIESLCEVLALRRFVMRPHGLAAFEQAVLHLLFSGLSRRREAV